MRVTASRFVRLRLLVFLGAVLAVSGCAPAEELAPTARPNVIFIYADDHAIQAVGAYGSRINRTPNIDRLASEGMLFERSFVTNSICAPARAVILTGKYSHRNGQLTNQQTFDGTQRTFPKLLQQAGYQTVLIGKWHLQSDPTGFDHWNILIGQGPYYNPPMIRNGEQMEHAGYTTDVITDLTLDWLRKERDPERPFFLMYQHKAPHREWAPGPDHLSLYDDLEIPEPPTLLYDYSGLTRAARMQEMTIRDHLTPRDLKLEPPPRLTEEQLQLWNTAYGPKNEAFEKANLAGDDLVKWKYQRYIKDYLRTVASIDDNLGRLLDYLEESGLSRNTVVIYSSDQGFFLGEKGWYDKRWMYEESLSTPLIVRWPGVVRPGSRSREMVLNLDMAPTFMELTGETPPEDMQGRSLVGLLRGESPGDWRKSIYYHYYELPGPHSVQPHYGVRTERHKLIHFYQLEDWELFDLERDPQELQSVYDDPGYAGIREELKAELERLREYYAEDTPEYSVSSIR